MTENDLTRAAAAAQQREQDRRVQYLQDQQRRRDQQVQAERLERIAALRIALHATFGAELEGELGGCYIVVGDLSVMQGVYEVHVADVVLRLRQVRDDVHEQWVCEAVAGGMQAAVEAVPDRIEINRDRLLLALHALYCRCSARAGDEQRAVGAESDPT